MARGDKHMKLEIRWPWLLSVPLLLLFGSCGSCIVKDLRSPARQSDEAIQAEMLLATPIATEYAEARRYIDHRFPGNVWDAWIDYHGKHPKKVYVKYGSYTEQSGFPLSTVVQVSWWFDPDGRLEEIKVSRHGDGP